MSAQGPANISGAAARYAAAVYAHASDIDRLAPVIANLERLGQVIDASPDLQRVLASPLTDPKQAQAALRSLIRTYELGLVARQLVDVVIMNRRLAMLRTIIAAFLALVAEKRGITTAYVASAHALSDVQEQALRARLIELGYGSVRIEKSVDRSLLGGLVLRVGSRLFDSSLRSRLQRLQFALKGAA